MAEYAGALKYTFTFPLTQLLRKVLCCDDRDDKGESISNGENTAIKHAIPLKYKGKWRLQKVSYQFPAISDQSPPLQLPVQMS